MKTIKTKLFAKWAYKNEISDRSLLGAAREIAADNYEAHYVMAVALSKKELPIREGVKAVVLEHW